MLLRVDIKAKLEDLGVSRNTIVSGMRPIIRIKEDYLTTGIMEFEETTQDSGLQDVNIMFVTPRYYPNSVWMGKRMEMCEGAKVIGYITVTEITNPILDRDKEKWVCWMGVKYIQ